MSLELSWNERVISGGQIEEFRKQVERRKRELQKATKYIGQVGHGYKRRTQALNKFREK